MKNYYTLFLVLMVLPAFAQPTITSAWVPTLGQSTRNHIYNGFGSTPLTEGSSGANVTWDQRTFDTVGSAVYTYISPSTAPQHASFTGATDCSMTSDSSQYLFSALNGSVYQFKGLVEPTSGGYDVLSFSDPQDYFHFPVTYLSTFTDAAASRDVVAGTLNGGARITETVTADGYGTLITNAGTFPNVMRIHTASLEIDTSYSGGSVVSIDSVTTDTYAWISAAHPGILLANIAHVLSFGFPSDEGYYADAVATGLLTQNDLQQLAVYPNPTSDKLNISAEGLDNGNYTITLKNVLGQTFLSDEMKADNNSIQKTVSLSSLPDAIYFLTIENAGSRIVRKIEKGN